MNKEDQYGEMMSGTCDAGQIDLCEELTGKECPIANYNECPGYEKGSIMEIPKDRMRTCEYHGDFPMVDVCIIDDGIRMCPICYYLEKDARRNCLFYPDCPTKHYEHYSVKMPCEECEQHNDPELGRCDICGDPVLVGQPMCDRCYWNIREG